MDNRAENNRRYYAKMRLDPEFRKRRAEHSRKSRQLHLEQNREHARAYGAKRRLDPTYVEREKQRAKDRRVADPEANKARLRDRQYGPGAHEYFKQSVTEQEKKCAICGDELDMGYQTHLDHNHDTGQWRSVLCGGCNAGLGNFKEDTERLLKAISYIKKWEVAQCTP